MKERRSYRIKPIRVNGIRIVQVVIDPHYEEKHKDYMSDALILDLVRELDGQDVDPDDVKGPFSYYSSLVEHGASQYRLVWLLEKNAIFIGVVNAYRDRRRK